MTAPTSINSKPIGVFDSGVGGLAIYRALREQLPFERFAYFADSKYCPYGARKPADIETRVSEIAAFLVELGAKAIVVACNTATVHAVDALRKRYDLPVIGVEPGIKPAVAASETRKIVLLATQRTLESGSIARLRSLYGDDSEFVFQPCPGLVERVEAGDFKSAATSELLHRFVRPALEGKADTIVLGCTHFIFLEAQIRAIVGLDIAVVEPSTAVAQQLVRKIDKCAPRVEPGTFSEDQFFTSSDMPEAVSAVASNLLGAKVRMLRVNGQMQEGAT